MFQFTLNGEARTFPEPLTVADLIVRLGYVLGAIVGLVVWGLNLLVG